MAAIGPTALSYRNFDAKDSAPVNTPASSIATTFPLLADALPEIATQTVRPAVANAATKPMQFEPLPPLLTEQPEFVASPRPSVQQPASAPPRRSAMRQTGTALASVFRLLRGQAPSPQPNAKPGLNDLFRRL